MLTSQQQQMLQNSHNLAHPSLSFSYSPVSPSQTVNNNTATPADPIKQAVQPPPPAPPSSSSSTIASAPVEATESSHLTISPSPTPLPVPHLSEAVQPSLPSDAQQPQVSGNLIHQFCSSAFFVRFPVVYNNSKFFLWIPSKNKTKPRVPRIVVTVKQRIRTLRRYHQL